MLADEFTAACDLHTWKKAVAGETFVTDVKGKAHRELRLAIPMVFIGQRQLEELTQEDGIRERLKIIRATPPANGKLTKELNH